MLANRVLDQLLVRLEGMIEEQKLVSKEEIPNTFDSGFEYGKLETLVDIRELILDNLDNVYGDQ